MRKKHKIVVPGETSTDLKHISWGIDKGLHARFALGECFANHDLSWWFLPSFFLNPKRNKSITKTGWWFQPLWKICSSKWESSPNRVENKTYLSCHHLENHHVNKSKEMTDVLAAKSGDPMPRVLNLHFLPTVFRPNGGIRGSVYCFFVQVQ